ncbi:MAG: hypothetical protein AB7O37_16920 [Vicinamibacteria bacterium]
MTIQVFEKQKFAPFYDQDSGRTFSDLEFRKCSFFSSAISITRKPELRSMVRGVKLIQCEQRGCALETAVVEDVLVDGFKTNGLFQTWGAVFKHVTLRGKIGRVMISPCVATAQATAQQQRAFDEANAAYYAGVDWALDISEAEVEELDIRGVPARLIRRDPDSQVVVTRERAMRGEWRRLDLSKTYWGTGIEFLLERGDPDVVLVAPKRNRKYRDLIDGLKVLRDAGVAEPT